MRRGEGVRHCCLEERAGCSFPQLHHHTYDSRPPSPHLLIMCVQFHIPHPTHATQLTNKQASSPATTPAVPWLPPKTWQIWPRARACQQQHLHRPGQPAGDGGGWRVRWVGWGLIVGVCKTTILVSIHVLYSTASHSLTICVSLLAALLSVAHSCHAHNKKHTTNTHKLTNTQVVHE